MISLDRLTNDFDNKIDQINKTCLWDPEDTYTQEARQTMLKLDDLSSELDKLKKTVERVGAYKKKHNNYDNQSQILLIEFRSCLNTLYEIQEKRKKETQSKKT